MTEGLRETPELGKKLYTLRRWIIFVVLLGLAGILLANPWPFVSPVAPPTPIPPWAVNTAPVRSPGLKPEIVIASYRYRCNECHSLVPSPVETDRPLTQHREIQLRHGINNRCFNCHLRENREAFADYRGGPIPYDQPYLVCGKCHGPVYRDWTHGVHGRTSGYWSTSMGPMRRLRCVECHDPHSPAFQSLKPAPPPDTLRMGDQTFRSETEERVKNPLLIFRQATTESETAAESTDSEESH